jgi:hypothetical protein
MLPVICIVDLLNAVIPIDLKNITALQGSLLTLAPFVLLPLYQAAIVVLLKSRYDGANLTTGRCYRHGSDAYVRLLVMYIVMGIAVFFGFMLLIIPGIYLIGRFCLADYFCVLEEKSYTESLTLSWNATKQFQWPILGGYLLVALLQAMPTYLLGSLVGILELENAVVDFVIGAISTILMVMITAYTFRVYCFLEVDEPKQGEVV